MKKINSPRVPVYRDTGFELYDADITSGIFGSEAEHRRNPDLYIYSRYRNPTVVAAEDEIIKIEKCNWALLVQSGMAAIDCALSIFQEGNKTHPWLFFTEIYGGTLSYIDAVLRRRRGLKIETFSPENGRYDLAAFEKMMSVIRPSVVYAETISNPLLIVTDIEEVIRISHKYGAKVIIDNTFATALLYRPLERGADLVIHSATKYLAGHGNITAGVVCGNDNDLCKSVIEYRKYVGHMLSPDDAYRLTTQMKTFEMRVSQQFRNASELAEVFEKENKISKVFFPGLKDHPTHQIASKLFGEKQFGAMVTFDFAGGTREQKKQRRDNFIKAVSNDIKLIPTLGDPRTILMPVEAVWGSKYAEPGMIRMSVGFENLSELKKIILKGLEKA